LLLVSLAKKNPPDGKAIRTNLTRLLPCGIMMGFNWILLFESYRYTTVAVATLFYYLAPVIILLLSPIVLKEKMTALKAGCIAAALLGMLFVSGILQSSDLSGFNFRGIALGFAAAVLYAFVVLLNKQLKGISSEDATMTELGTAAAVMIPYNLLTVDLSALSCDTRGLVLLAFVAIVHTGICYAIYFSCITALPAQTGALFSYIDPVVAILLSALVLHEPMDTLCIIGAALILGSTLVGELFEKKK
jgi:RarD protein